MEYVWDQKKLMEIKKAYKDLRKNTEGLTKKDLEKIKKSLSFIKEMKKIIHPPRKKYTLKEDKNFSFSYETLKEMEKIPPFIKKTLLALNQNFIFFKEKIDTEKLPLLPLTNDELISLQHDFFNWLPNKELRNKLNVFLNQKGLIYFDNTINNTYSGITYAFHFPYYIPFFHIVRDNTLDDFLACSHEFFHGYSMEYDANISLFPNRYYLHELEGFFAEYLALQFLKEKHLFSSMLPTLEKNNYLEYIEYLKDFHIQSISYEIYMQKESVSVEEVNKKLLEDQPSFPLNEEMSVDILLSLLDSPTETAAYGFSFLTSLDLEILEQQDRELALEIFLHIRTKKTNNLKKLLEDNHITFMQDNYNNLRKKVLDLHFNKD